MAREGVRLAFPGRGVFRRSHAFHGPPCSIMIDPRHLDSLGSLG